MTSWNHHHPPHDHPDFDAYLDTLTENDLAAMNAAMNTVNDTAPHTTTSELNTGNNF